MKTIATFFVFALTICFGQTGPGGIGTTDGTSSLKLWLDAADATTKTLNTTTVSQWSDKSGYLSHGTQSQAIYQPTNNATGINSRQTITFDGTDDVLSLPNNSVLTNNAPFSFFCIMKPATLTGYTVIYCAGSGGGSTAFETNGSNLNFYDAGTPDGVHNANGSSTLTADTTYIYDANLTPGVGTAILKMNLNGVNDFTSSATTFGSPVSGPERSIGGTVSSEFWNGDIGEVIIYNSKLNDAQRNIVGSYLGAKWNISFSGSKYGGSSTYGDNVIGIGKESDGSNTSAKQGGITLTDNSSMNANGEYLLAGHTSGTNSVTTSDVGSSGTTNRWNRIWYVDKTGTLDGGNAQIGFDYSDAGMSGSPVTAGNYRLLFRSGTSGNFSAVTTAASSISGDNINFNVTDANLIDGYYTLGTTNNSSSPLPVELTSFNATTFNNSVTLNWLTVSEVNNYGFEIEKTLINDQPTANNWQKVGFVEGSGTTNSPKKYSFTETNLTSGKYSYRLKQIDRDGKIEYSKEVEVTVANAPKEFTLSQNYPNPFNPSTVISYQIPVNDHVSLTIYDALGREVGILVNETKEAGYYSAAFDASKLSSGIYFARLQSGERTQLKKMQLLK